LYKDQDLTEHLALSCLPHQKNTHTGPSQYTQADPGTVKKEE
jgi:hypothetical protein